MTEDRTETNPAELGDQTSEIDVTTVAEEEVDWSADDLGDFPIEGEPGASSARNVQTGGSGGGNG